MVSPPKTANAAPLRFGLVDALVSLAQSEVSYITSYKYLKVSLDLTFSLEVLQPCGL